MSKLKMIFCKYWTSIKIKISMTCCTNDYENKNGTGAMTIAKNFLVFIGW